MICTINLLTVVVLAPTAQNHISICIYSNMYVVRTLGLERVFSDNIAFVHNVKSEHIDSYVKSTCHSNHKYIGTWSL